MKLRFEGQIKLIQRIKALHFARFDHVELAFQGGCEGNIEHLGKILDQKFCDNTAQVGWVKPPFFQPDIFSVLDRTQDCCIGTRPADAVLLQFTNQ